MALVVAPGRWQWTITPFVVAATALTLWIYSRGIAKAGAWQRVGFLSGTALLFLALQSPLDALAEESFAVHQLQHLALLSIVPMLIALSSPAGPLLAGMPDWLRRRVYVPIASVRRVRAAFSFLSTPPVAAAGFIAMMATWLLPALQETALRDESVHDLMHFSMLFAGLFLYFCAFDRRPPPTGSHYGARVFSLLAVLLANIPLGAYLSYKETVRYPVYHAAAALGLAPIADERLGGLIQYVPGSMMLVAAVLLVLHAWRRQELRLEGWRRRGFIRKASLPRAGRTPERNNLRLGLALAGIGAFMFVAVVVAGILAHR
ncbi:MAG TPA: cytochrome c oxidase assembly protein [Burkholderiales bacterium]|nr:cytochrome c oxidase assembly protein [Burkholderiales bacterium]